jgi:predicted nucleic acid-binding protein
MIVADTNLVAYFIIPGTTTPDAESVRAKDNDWVAPGLLRFEWLNVVAQQFRLNHVDRDCALRTFRRGLTLVNFTKLQSDPLFILNMCQTSGCSPYDLEFIWLAMELGVPLVTADQKLIDAFPGVAVHLSEFGRAKIQ